MTEFTGLQHVRRTTPDGVSIILVDTGAELDAEVVAMIQALQSRSNEGVEHHLTEVAKKGPQKFMASYYVGYGHKSIGDCGTFVVFVEGGSMLSAKALQDWFSYTGQEGSTRYMNFGTQRFMNPLGTPEGEHINERWRGFYVENYPLVVAHLKERFPRGDNEDQTKYDKAIDARAFDIMRGFLPAGATTKLSWGMNLRQAADQLARLRHHPLLEVQEIADAIGSALKERYPSSFSHKRYEETERFNEMWMKHHYYFRFFKDPGFTGDRRLFHHGRLNLYKEVLEARPPKTELPKELASCGTIEANFCLDFASFRDLQRHRAVNQRMPILELAGGFEDWYLEELPATVNDAALDLLFAQEEAIKALEATPEEKQYYIAMGYRIECEIVGGLPALVYLVELRATRFVHPTLRKRALQMAGYLEKEFGPFGLRLHLDPDPDRFDVKRGQHDIVKV